MKRWLLSSPQLIQTYVGWAALPDSLGLTSPGSNPSGDKVTTVPRSLLGIFSFSTPGA